MVLIGMYFGSQYDDAVAEPYFSDGIGGSDHRYRSGGRAVRAFRPRCDEFRQGSQEAEPA